MQFQIYCVTLFCPNITITISSAVSLQWQSTNHTKIKTRIIYRLGEFYFPILSSNDDISFRRVLGSAHVKFDIWTGPHSRNSKRLKFAQEDRTDRNWIVPLRIHYVFAGKPCWVPLLSFQTAPQPFWNVSWQIRLMHTFLKYIPRNKREKLFIVADR